MNHSKNIQSSRRARRAMIAGIAAMGLGAMSTESLSADIPVGVDGCTLEAAIISANLNAANGGCPAGDPGMDTLIFEPLSTHSLSVAFPSFMDSQGGTPVITESLEMLGNGAVIERAEGAPDFRLLTISGPEDNDNEPTSVHISGLTFRNGRTTNGRSGAGILFLSRGPDENLSLTRTVFEDNQADGHGGALAVIHPTGQQAGRVDLLQVRMNGNGAQFGGAIYTQLTNISARYSSFVDNSALLTGGAIYTIRGEVSLDTSTVSGNSARTGGGLAGFQTERTSLTDSTISNNASIGESGGNGAGGLFVVGSLDLTRTIIAGNTALTGIAPEIYWSADEGATPTGEGHNLIGFSGDAGTGVQSPVAANQFTPGPSDIVPDVPLEDILLPLNDSAFPYHALPISSPAINAGGHTCSLNDQRGTLRPRGEACDIGAIEYGGSVRLEALPLVQSLVRQGLGLGLRYQVGATATDVDGTPIPGLTILFTAGTQIVCTGVTGENGQTTCTNSDPISSVDVLLNLGYTATFQGNSVWDRTVDQSDLLVPGL